MQNIFYLPHLEKTVRETKIENGIRSIAMNVIGSKDITKEEILDVLEWLRKEKSDAIAAKDAAKRRVKKMEGRIDSFLKLPAVHLKLRSEINLDELKLTRSAFDSLQRSQITTVSQLCDKTEDELKNICGINGRLIDEIKEKLSGYGLSLLDSEDDIYTGEYDDISEKYLEDIKAELDAQFFELFGDLDDDD